MRHIDLFSGIGGFALAVDTVWPNSEHIFCDNDPFCQQVIKKHWPNSKIYGDIRTLTANTASQRWFTGGGDRQEGQILHDQNRVSQKDKPERNGWERGATETASVDILTGGFPCQPFSQAGRRQGTADNRYLWPQMFRVIREFHPTWVIAENVRGLVTWNEGMVLEQVCADLESEGYEVQPLIIPAVAVGAPHRRDRVWIIGHNPDTQRQRRQRGSETQGQGYAKQPDRDGSNETQSIPRAWLRPSARIAGEYGRAYASLTANARPQRRSEGSGESLRPSRLQPKQPDYQYPDWGRSWQEVAFATCNDGMDDGLSRRLDGITISGARHRRERLKAMGNAIVPQVAMNILAAVKESEGL